ncbi:hypothetical protein GCM10010524_58320 [Streptomyces mexicanus]
MAASPTPSASIHEPISLGPAPAALAAVNTSAAELVTPTVTAISPAATADGGAAARRRAVKEDIRATSGSGTAGCGVRRAGRAGPVAADVRGGRTRFAVPAPFHKRNVLFVEH